jgi:hypothetical protein
MNDLAPIPLALFERLAGAGLDVDAILHRANLPRSRFNVARPRAQQRRSSLSGVPWRRVLLLQNSALNTFRISRGDIAFPYDSLGNSMGHLR